jgi:hypothetical protein
MRIIQHIIWDTKRRFCGLRICGSLAPKNERINGNLGHSKARSVTNYFWYYSEVLFLVPPNSTSNSAETSSKNTIFLRGFGTIQGTIRRYYFLAGIFVPRKRNTVTTSPSPPPHCRHLRRCTATTFAAVLPPPPPPHYRRCCRRRRRHSRP